MSSDLRAAGTPLADQSAEVALSAPKLLGKGFKTYERYQATVRDDDGPRTQLTRDILHFGRVIGVLPIDLPRGRLVLIRQFRLAAHLANGHGDLIEIVAGFVDPVKHPSNRHIGNASRRSASRPMRSSNCSPS